MWVRGNFHKLVFALVVHKHLSLDYGFCIFSNSLFILQKQVEWSCCAKSVGTLLLVSIMECTRVKVVR